MTLDELEKELARNVRHAVYLLLGPEEFLRQRALTLLRTKLLDECSLALNYSEFSASERPISEMLETANTFPMLSRVRIVLLSGLEAMDAPAQELLLDYVRQPSIRTALILNASELDKRTTFYKAIRDHSCVVELAKLKGYALSRWAEDWIRGRGYRISPAALKKLIDLAGSDLQTLANEIEKILIFCGDNKNIPDAAVEELVRGSRQHGIFELTEAVGRRDKARALHLLANLLNLGEQPLMILVMLARHFRQILIAKDLELQGKPPHEIGAAAQIPPFILDEFLAQARAMDQASAEGMYLRLAEADLRFKSSPTNQRTYLERIIYGL
jgi:DNA polymerase-3 subunit delta